MISTGLRYFFAIIAALKIPFPFALSISIKVRFP